MTATQLSLIDLDDPTDERRYPVEQLVRLASIGDARLAELVGLDRTQVGRRRRSPRGLDAYEADRWACAVGYLPHEVWPEWLSDEMEEIAS